jgi:hypothetical protein
LLDPDACFVQPLFPVARGVTEIERLFRAMFGVMPDLTLTVTGPAASTDAVYIESVCTAIIGRGHVAFDVWTGSGAEPAAFTNVVPARTRSLS